MPWQMRQPSIFKGSGFGPRWKRSDNEMLRVWREHRLRDKCLREAGNIIGVDKKTAQRLVKRCEESYKHDELVALCEQLEQPVLFPEVLAK
jgi:Mn-dependent DtxR family transcriptional regulator